MKSKKEELLSGLFWGLSIGLLHVIILWIMSDETMRTASFMLYGDPDLLTFAVVAVVDAFALLILISSGCWLPLLMDYRDKFVAEKYERDQDFEEDIPCSGVLVK